MGVVYIWFLYDAPNDSLCFTNLNVHWNSDGVFYIFVGIENSQITSILKYWHSCAHRWINTSGSIQSEIKIRNYWSACKTLLLGFQFDSYLCSSIPNDLQVTFATSTCYILIATICNKLIFLCSFVFLCQQKYSHSFTQEVSVEKVSTGRRKDQRWWVQGKLKRKVFLWFLSWPKDRKDAEQHCNAMQLVSGREVPWEVLGPVLFLLMAEQQAPWHNQLPQLHRSSSFLSLLNPRFPGNGCVAWHLQFRMCPATCWAELAMKNECFWGNNTLYSVA